MRFLSGFIVATTLMTGVVSADGLKNIEPQPLAQALDAWARQTGLQVIYGTELTTGRKSAGAAAGSSAKDALTQILDGSGLSYSWLNERTVAIRAAQEKVSFLKDAQVKTDDKMRMAQSEAPAGASGEGQVVASKKEISEIIVTAQKRAERLQDVPVPVTAIDAQALADSNQLRLQDYYTRVPGLSLALFGNENAPQISIRGITTGGFTNPTVGIVVDDVSYGATAVPGASPTVPDIDPGDLARIEVLRGPQGTLYGAANIGGLLKFVTIDPSKERITGRLQAGVNSVHASSDLGYSVRGSANVPVGETLAFRASGFTLRDPGYVDNIQTRKRDDNRRDSRGGRVSALWRPSEDFSLKLSAMLQNTERDAPDQTDISLGSGFQLRSFPSAGNYVRDVEAYSATMNVKLGGIELTSLTGYNFDTTLSRLDQSAGFGDPGVTGAVQVLNTEVEKFTQELRAIVPIGERIKWLMGAFYTKEKVRQSSLFNVADLDTGADGGKLFESASPSSFEEYSLFSNVTVDITERFDLQLGARTSRNEQTYGGVLSGPLADAFFGSDPFFQPNLHSEDSASTYQITPRFRISPDLMLYTRIASGYRPGGPNTNCGILGVPCEYDPDTTVNYELGFKGGLLDNLLMFDASVYYIDWKDIQINLSAGGFGYTENATRAKSQGMELSVESKPTTGMTISTWIAFNDATLTEDFPATASASGISGDRLPHSSRFSGSLSIDQEFPLGAVTSGFVGGAVSYVDKRKGIFKPATAARETLGGYVQTDLRIGARFESWTLNVFVNNVTDERGILRTGVDTFQPTYLTYIQPRTIGLVASKTF